MHPFKDSTMTGSSLDPVNVRTPDHICEVAWFDDLCGGDTQFLGVPDPQRASSFEHCLHILQTADRLGYSNILLPTSYLSGQEVIPFAAAGGVLTRQINLLAAIRTGEIHPPMLARHLSTLDHMLKGRLCINIINSALPGVNESPETRYRRCEAVIQFLQQAWKGDQVHWQTTDNETFPLPAAPVKPYHPQFPPMLYFGGISEGSRELCAKYCDVFLMWPEPESHIHATMKDLAEKAGRYGRRIDFGLRIHVIVRDTEKEARDYARYIMSRFNPGGFNLKTQTQDHQSAGVRRQDDFRNQLADADDYIEPLLWTGIGRARSGCGGALVGTPEQILEKLHRYMHMGIRSFIFSGYPLLEECHFFAQHVLPHLPNRKLNEFHLAYLKASAG